MPQIEQSITAFRGLDAYLEHHGLTLRTDPKGHVWFTHGANAEEKLIRSSLKPIAGGEASTMFGTLLVLTKRLRLPFLFEVQEPSSIFKGSLCEVKYSPGWNPPKSSSIILTYRKQAVALYRPWEFFPNVQISTETHTKLVEQTVPKDPFGATYDLGDIVLYDSKPGVVEEWRPLDQQLIINMGTRRYRVDVFSNLINATKLDIKILGRDLMIKKLKRK